MKHETYDQKPNLRSDAPEFLHRRLGSDAHLHPGLQHDDKLFSDEFVRPAEVLFDQSEAGADTEEIRQRVEISRLPVM